MNRLRSLPYHTLLLALYPVLFFYVHNIDQLRPQQVLGIFIAVMTGTALFWTLLTLILKDTSRSSMIASLGLVLFFSYGHVRDFSMEILGADNGLRIGRILLPLWASLFTGGTIAIVYGKKLSARFSGAANVAAFVLISIPLITAVSVKRHSVYIARPSRAADTSINNGKVAPESTGQRPDIYYFILDRHAGPGILEKYFSYDERPFIEMLESRGFVVAKKSRTNYPGTIYSLTSSLNMKYLSSLLDTLDAGCCDDNMIQEFLRNSAVVSFLKSRGYMYYNFGSWWPATNKNPNADFDFADMYRRYRYAGISFDERSASFLRTTAVYPLLARFMPVGLEQIQRRTSLDQFGELSRHCKDPGPKFVFVHILLPHEPYVFGKSGEYVTDEERRTRTGASLYLDQLIFTDAKIGSLVDTILAQSPGKPIIVIQSDEGYFQGDSVMESHAQIFNAYLLPGVDAESLIYPSISPVNTFRVIFNAYFGTALELLPDNCYLVESGRRPIGFTLLTESTPCAAPPDPRSP